MKRRNTYLGLFSIVLMGGYLQAQVALASNGGSNGGSSNGSSSNGNTNAGNQGNGVGNTGPGNQGNGPNSGTAGNSGGSSNGSSTNGSSTNGSSTNGSSTNGSSTNGSSTNGSSTNGSSTNGSSTNGSSTNGSSTNGSSTNGSSTNGSSTNGSSTNGSSTNGSSTNGSSSNGNTNSGNQGNGVGNTGPGDQGNGPNSGTAGNSGGSTNGSSNGGSNGSSNGSSNGNSNGNANGTTNGGSNGNSNGNANGTTNGNANGNSNGNANGTTNGNANGNSNGNANGTTNGGSNGNSNGNSNGHSNGTTNGNSNGNSNGHSNGTTNGNSNGNSNGHSNGTTNGNSNGNSNGHSNGTTNGNSNGESNGHSNGHSNGNCTGHTNGTTNGSANGTTNGNSNGTTNGGSSNGSSSNGGSDNGGNGGSDNGKSDNGGGNNQKPAQQEPRKHWEFDIAPIFYLDLDFGTKLVNLTPASGAIAAPEKGQKSGATLLEVDNYKDGFRYLQTGSLDVGAGVLGYWHYVNAAAPTVMPFVGILPMTGTSVLADRFVQTQDAIKTLPQLGFPGKADMLKSWNVHDTEVYTSTGSVLYFGGVAYTGVSASISYLARGEWATYVEKLENNQALVKITNTKLNDLSANLTVGIVAVGTSAFKGADDSFSYVYDLNDKAAANAYEDMVKGSVAASQKLASTTHTVKLDTSSKVRRIGRLSYFWFGVPIFLNTTSTSEEVYSVAHSDLNAEKATSDAEYGIYLREKKNRVFFTHSSRLSSFYGASYKETDAAGKVNEGYLGKFVWNWEDDDSSASGIRESVQELSGLTGLSKDLSVELPTKSRNMGYAGVKFSMTLPQATTDYLVAFAASKNGAAAIDATITKMLKSWLADKRASDSSYMRECSSSKGGAQQYSYCPDRMAQTTRSGAADMKAALVKMAQTRDSKRAEFVKAYGDFGRGMLTNEVTFRSIMAIIQGQPLEYKYQVEGQRLSMLKKQITSSNFKTPDTLVNY